MRRPKGGTTRLRSGKWGRTEGRSSRAPSSRAQSNLWHAGPLGRGRRRRGGSTSRRGDAGQVSVLILAMTLIAATLTVGGIAVTSAQLSRVRLLDAADAAALDAADELDTTAYQQGLDNAVPISDATVQASAASYLANRPRPVGMIRWWVSAGTGSPDGQTALVRLSGEADLPLVGKVLSALGGSVTITVESRARAELSP